MRWNQLQRKFLAVCIEGMGENMQYLAYFGAKFTFFIAFFRHFVLRYILHGYKPGLCHFIRKLSPRCVYRQAGKGIYCLAYCFVKNRYGS